MESLAISISELTVLCLRGACSPFPQCLCRWIHCRRGYCNRCRFGLQGQTCYTWRCRCNRRFSETTKGLKFCCLSWVCNSNSWCPIWMELQNHHLHENSFTVILSLLFLFNLFLFNREPDTRGQMDKNSLFHTNWSSHSCAHHQNNLPGRHRKSAHKPIMSQYRQMWKQWKENHKYTLFYFVWSNVKTFCIHMTTLVSFQTCINLWNTKLLRTLNTSHLFTRQ